MAPPLHEMVMSATTEKDQGMTFIFLPIHISVYILIINFCVTRRCKDLSVIPNVDRLRVMIKFTKQKSSTINKPFT